MIQMNHCENLRQHLKSLNSTFIFGQTFIIVYVQNINFSFFFYCTIFLIIIIII